MINIMITVRIPCDDKQYKICTWEFRLGQQHTVFMFLKTFYQFSVGLGQTRWKEVRNLTHQIRFMIVFGQFLNILLWVRAPLTFSTASSMVSTGPQLQIFDFKKQSRKITDWKLKLWLSFRSYNKFFLQSPNMVVWIWWLTVTYDSASVTTA